MRGQMAALRILHVTPYFEHAWAYGGIPRVVSALATGLAGRGHRVTVCTTDAALATQRLARPDDVAVRQPWTETGANGVAVHVFPNVSNRAAYELQLFLPIGLDRYLRAHARDFDIAHIHACRNVPGSVASRHLWRAKVPYVLQPHGTAPRIERRRAAKALFDRTIGRNVLERATRLLAVTEAERRQLHRLGMPDARIAVVPNPIDLGEFELPIERGAFRRRLGLSSERIVLFLGKLTPRKRLDVLARAFAQLRHPNARLVIAGNDMGYGRQLRRLIARLGIGETTIMTGLLTGGHRLEALADADIVVYASKDEIFGLVPIEALNSGTPVIVADDSGCGEVVNHLGGGMVIPEGDDLALAESLAVMLDAHSHWRADATLARARIPDFCGSAVVCRALEGVYDDVLAGGRP